MGSIIAAIVKGAVGALISPFVSWWQNRQLVNQGRAEQVASEAADLNKEQADALKAGTGVTSSDVDSSLRDGTF